MSARPLVGEVQRFGLLSAATVVDRYTAIVEAAMGTGAAAPQTTPDDAAQLIDATARMAHGYLRLLSGVAELAGPLGPQSQQIDRVALPPVPAGRRTAASLWLHNPSDSPANGLTLTVGDFVGAGGSTLPARSGSVAPSMADVAAGGLAELRLSLAVPAGQPLGTYHAIALIGPSPHDPVVLSLSILPAVLP